jgi:hypothetical protein
MLQLNTAHNHFGVINLLHFSDDGQLIGQIIVQNSCNLILREDYMARGSEVNCQAVANLLLNA